MAIAGPMNMSYPLVVAPTWNRLDIRELIINTSPKNTPFFEMTGTSPGSAVLHEWQTRGLQTRAVNAYLEGADYTWQNVSRPARPTNTMQILQHGAEVSGTAEAQGYYGIGSLMADQIALRAIEHRNDLEFNLIRASHSIGATDEARQMDGLVNCVSTNATDMAGITLTESAYQDFAETIWLTGAEPDTVLLGSKLQRRVNSFSADSATKWIDTTTREVVNKVLVYHSSFATLMNILSRDLSNGSTMGELVMFDKSMVNVAYLRTTQLVNVPSVSDAQRKSMVTEACLEWGNELAFHYSSNFMAV